MTVLFLAILGIQLGFLLVARHNRRHAPRLAAFGSPLGHPKVSVLVPARNEAANLADHLPALLASDYPGLDVVVLDDGSTDGTRFVLQRLRRRFPGRMRVLQGRPLPAGWNGKNWACHQLAAAATGAILIFCDADVHAEPGAVAATVGAMQRSGAGVVTGLPRQMTGSVAERAVVPWIVHWPLWAVLPLARAWRSRRPSLAVGNGQWLAFRRRAYRRLGGHRSVRDAFTEDVVLARRAKAAGLRVLPALAPELLATRMYEGWGEVATGFRRTLAPLTGTGAGAAAVGAVLLVGHLLPLLLLPFDLRFALPLAVAAAVHASANRAFGRPAGELLWRLPGLVAVLALLGASVADHRRGTVAWKGRSGVAPDTGSTTESTPAPKPEAIAPVRSHTR